MFELMIVITKLKDLYQLSTEETIQRNRDSQIIYSVDAPTI